jgi:eukaryotic-like serine/threonine-protein kinase
MLDPVFLRLQALVAGRFSLEREIGRGGMGIVYLARDVALERPVAIKVLAPSLAARAEMRARFLREARIAAQCFHPHIVPIHAVEEADDLAWIVMAYVRGETLADRIRRTGPLPADEVRRLAREVGWALAYAHQRGVVHRDIKPENLLIDVSTGRFVIADFGIALAVDHHTPTGTVAGTARYMAPEQALGEEIDGRADLYALGVTLFFAASGRLPFDGASAVALVAQHAAQPAPSVRSVVPTMPLELARAIDRCLAKQPDQRFADAGHFLAAIEPDVRDAPLPPAFRAVHDDAAGARSMLWWTGVVGVSSVLLAIGEKSGSLGYEVITSVGMGATLMFGAASVFRGIEAMLGARSLLRGGHDRQDVARALTGTHVSSSTEGRRGGAAAWATVGAGAALALSQGTVTDLPLPDFLSGIMQIVTLFMPPMLMARGAEGMLHSARPGRWLREVIHRKVVAPTARLAVRWLSPRSASALPNPSFQALADAPTEVLLVRAVESAVGALPAAQRATMADADGIARGLAQQITRLRADAQRLDEREADALVVRDSAVRQQTLDAIRQERIELQARLQTAMAALESLRLDVLQLGAGGGDTGLTTELGRAREVQHRVDAIREVRELLRTPT